jgi:hypothetical protein
MPEYTVNDGVTPLVFDAEWMVEESTWSRGSVRWLDMELYQHKNGTYLVHTVACSNIYHRPDAPECHAGEPTKAEDLHADAIPCNRCDPPERFELKTGDLVNAETDNHTVYHSLAAGDIRAKLRNPNLPDEGKLTAPARRLLNKAMLLDGELAKALTAPQRLE